MSSHPYSENDSSKPPAARTVSSGAETCVRRPRPPSRRKRRRDVARPKIVAAVVPDTPDRRRQSVETFDFDCPAAHDCAWMYRMRSQVLFDEVRQHQHVVVDENDALARRSRDPRVSPFGQTGVRLPDDGQAAAGALACAFDRSGGVVGRTVVDQHDLVLVFGNRLLETRVEHALEQRGAVVRAKLNRSSHLYHHVMLSEACAARAVEGHITRRSPRRRELVRRRDDRRKRSRRSAPSYRRDGTGTTAGRSPCADRAAPSARESRFETERFRPWGNRPRRRHASIQS